MSTAGGLTTCVARDPNERTEVKATSSRCRAGPDPTWWIFLQIWACGLLRRVSSSKRKPKGEPPCRRSPFDTYILIGPQVIGFRLVSFQNQWCDPFSGKLLTRIRQSGPEVPCKAHETELPREEHRCSLEIPLVKTVQQVKNKHRE